MIISAPAGLWRNLQIRQALVGAAIALALAAAAISLWDPSYALPLVVGSAYAAVLNLSGPPGERVRGMGWAVVWLGLATLAGGLISPYSWIEIGVVAIVGLVGGYVAVLGRRATVISVLSMSIFAVFAGLDFSVEQSFKFAALMAAGGIVQLLVWLVAIAMHSPQALRAQPVESEPVLSRLKQWDPVHQHFLRHALRLSIALAVGTVLANQLQWPHPYWIPMTIAIMSKPDASGTATRVVERILGTFLGVGVALVLVGVFGDGGILVPIYAAAGVAVLLAFQNAKYAIAVTGMTVLIMTMMTYVGDPILQTASFRVLATSVAGVISVIAAVMMWLVSRRVSVPVPRSAPDGG